MAGCRLAIVCLAMTIAGFAGCGKKAATQSGTESSPPPSPQGGPGPVVSGGPDKKQQQKVDFEGLVGNMRTYAGKARTSSTPSGYETLTQLTDEYPPTHERRADVYKALTQTAEKLQPADNAQYMWWATKYAGPENAADLLAITRSYATDVKTSPTSQAAFTRLVELKEPSTFPAIAAMLGDKVGLLVLESAKALKGIGAAAEKAVQPYAGPTGPGGKTNDFLLRVKAIELLGDIGTKDSLPLLQSLSSDPNSTIADKSKTAVAAIQSRTK